MLTNDSGGKLRILSITNVISSNTSSSERIDSSYQSEREKKNQTGFYNIFIRYTENKYDKGIFLKKHFFNFNVSVPYLCI